MKYDYPGISLFVAVVIVCLGSAGCAHRIPSAYSGEWAIRYEGKNMMLLTTTVHHNKVEGTLVEPKHFREVADGTFNDIHSPVVSHKLKGGVKRGAVILQIGEYPDTGEVRMKFLDRNHVSLDGFHGLVPDWTFERVPPADSISIFDGWDQCRDYAR